ncbi:hypothetical protein M408DRAFT_332686 [Serendipita vermifera MAFF 305830]|uniref:VWFA domain-containing protein n=1 Tax=Serendipita vermifera MAFF 305830 TaxID=933852 RepID=A0A0C2X042_SERVB|nr:hypothetical protein M408DRAFT_332686 [Serendipita vermifera MAFF 305830]
MDSDTASEASMRTAHSQLATPIRPLSPVGPTAPLQLPIPNSDRAPSPMDIDEPTPSEPSLDLMDHIPGLYRLLDLVQDRGGGGIVDKVIIAQESIKAFANIIRPGSYKSEFQVDFKGLDNHAIQPRGIYGSAPAIVDFLDSIGCMTEETRRWMLRNRDEASGISCPTLRPGLYLVSSVDGEKELTFIIFWPEDGTWDDGAISSVSRNRVTFMRYITKLCDQIDCLVSDEHTGKLVWKDELAQRSNPGKKYSAFKDRVFGYTVQRTSDEEDTVQADEGFLFCHQAIKLLKEKPTNFPSDLSPALLQSCLILGDINQAILQTRYIPDEVKPVKMKEYMKTMRLKELLSVYQSPYITLGEDMDHKSLKIVLDHGIWDRCGGLQQEWHSRCAQEKQKREDEKKNEMKKITAASKLEDALPKMTFWITKQAYILYNIVPEYEFFRSILPEGVDMETAECKASVANADTWLGQYPELCKKVIKSVVSNLQILDTSPNARYNVFKRQLLEVHGLIHSNRAILSDVDIQGLADLAVAEERDKYKIGVKHILDQANKNKNDGIGKKVMNFLQGLITSPPPPKRQSSIQFLSFQDDPAFVQSLKTLEVEEPQYQPVIHELKLEMVELLRHKTKKLSSSVLKIMAEGLKTALEENARDIFEKRRQNEEEEAWKYLKRQVERYLISSVPKQNNGKRITINSVTQEGPKITGQPEKFLVTGKRLSPCKAGFEYTIFPIEVKQDDLITASNNSDHICKPIARAHHAQPISLPINCHLRFTHLLENDLALVIIEEPDLFRIYAETGDLLSSTISQKKAIKTFHSGKLGANPLFAFDSTKRLLVIFSIIEPSVQLNVYSFDSASRSFNARGSPEFLTRWYSRIPEIIHLLFLNGTEELLLVEKGGLCRIFSLITANFRPSTLKLVGDPEAVFSTADGACLIMKILVNGEPNIFCYHWTSFGSNEGTRIPWPTDISPDSQMIVSSIGARQSVHIIFLDRQKGLCKSIRVRITSKSSEFTFRSNLRTGSSPETINTVNNSLIDCHAEVWTRFPVNAAIVKETVTTATRRQRSILFVSGIKAGAFASYFENMVRDFEDKTRKPTRDLLKQIIIQEAHDWEEASPRIPTSEFQVGDWLVGLFCLIPLHLAVTRSNRFIPFKNGVDSPEFEHELLGANVAQISEALSFGWYESIFSSYLASKPVKVVTSMGEQSVGKSFALNHFVDTSFAGSAMRCTEGVWLSVTPTRDYLVVAMDFEGVHSIERSAQEDTLLVLLNSAISNFVLFRNNFALSRDITGLFNSFQNCTKVLDPAFNPSLFRSALAIIIKDVVDSDTREIVNEFQQKFHRIVQKEKEENFITKLHGGRLDIIPWPIIESSHFYDLFDELKMQFDDQQVTHPHAGAFLGVLKMLMAKLKANDWGALDQNLATQRAQLLTALLPTVLAFGTTDPVNDEPLKNYDTDELLQNSDSPATFFVEDASHPGYGPLSLDTCLSQLRLGWKRREERFSMPEDEFVTGCNQYLSALAEARIGHVQTWIDVNTARFGEKAEITSLRRNFEQLSKELRTSTVLCGLKCSNCGLSCLEDKRHDGDHECKTNHKCPDPCGFAEEHEDVVECHLPAGHLGRHVCSRTPHLCGTTCQMYGKNGCLISCAKPMNHEDEGHNCAAGMHTCGELCSLVENDGTRLCDRSCTLDCRVPHELHTCDRSLSCPIRCQLCKSYCSAGDHFHALQANAVHLCGQKHDCKHLCEMDGVCEINTTPQSIESTFDGRYEKFAYTKYTQEARRLQCIISLAPDQLEHDGRHVHSNDLDPFHYCEEQCKHCGYYCTLPLRHVQSEHSTNHGSMARTEWIVEGEDDTILEVQGRKYATGDSGAPMLCSLLCEALGRHVHIDSCRPDEDGNCIGTELQHVKRPPGKGSNDWITHRLFWARSGFKDPYSQEKLDEFALCDHRCGGQEHDGDENSGAVPSFCVLPLFHGTPDLDNTPTLGHISHDGHAYKCKNPALMQRSFHIFFVLDHSGSMTYTDRRPLADSPATQRIVQHADNRFGAVVSSLYAFWTAREAAVRAGANVGQRRDAYSIITFHHTASVILSDDTVSDPDQLLALILGGSNYYGGTNYTAALEAVQKLMEDTWVTERSPVIIFLSDGECVIQDATIYDLCRSAARSGKGLAFNSVSFGADRQSHYLRRMATIAKEVYDTAPADPLAPTGVNPCSFTSALDTVQLASTFLSLAESLKNPRAALSRV